LDTFISACPARIFGLRQQYTFILLFICYLIPQKIVSSCPVLINYSELDRLSWTRSLLDRVLKETLSCLASLALLMIVIVRHYQTGIFTCNGFPVIPPRTQCSDAKILVSQSLELAQLLFASVVFSFYGDKLTCCSSPRRGDEPALIVTLSSGSYLSGIMS
jgi:hypothetical protein